MHDQHRALLSRCKRLLDVVLATSALIAVSPLLLIVALLIRITMGSPVLFRHERPGLHEKPFNLIKLKSMLNPKSEGGELLDLDTRVTRFGALIRRASIDEIPELWNVIRGEMSLVGPRPLLREYLPCYSPEQRQRHAVRPGVTGLAQVNGRHALEWDERFRLDVRYVDNWSLRLDALIIFATPRVLLSGQGTPPPNVADFWFTGPNEPE